MIYKKYLLQALWLHKANTPGSDDLGFLQPPKRETCMSIKEIKAFAEKAKADPALAEKLNACEKVRDILVLIKESGFNVIEDALYPPNEPQFSKDQLSPKMAKALLRA